MAEIAAELGADVPSQLRPGFSLVAGAGEVVEPLPPVGEFGVVLIPVEPGLSVGEVYAEADRLGAHARPKSWTAFEGELRDAAGSGASPLEYPELLVNDLQGAALSLRPEINEALVALEEAGAVAGARERFGPDRGGAVRRCGGG